MPDQPPIPTVSVFLLCDQVIAETGTNKKSLIGMFDRLFVQQLPALHLQPVWVFAKLTDASGEYTFRVEIVKLESDKFIGRMVTPKSMIKDRLKPVDIVLRLPPFPLSELGTYEFQLFANDVWIGRTLLYVEKIEKRRAAP